jgi:hypothetical protein
VRALDPSDDAGVPFIRRLVEAWLHISEREARLVMNAGSACVLATAGAVRCLAR